MKEVTSNILDNDRMYIPRSVEPDDSVIMESQCSHDLKRMYMHILIANNGFKRRLYFY